MPEFFDDIKDAKRIQYDNSQSGLSADNVQKAIDELDDKIDALQSGSGTIEASDVHYNNSNSGLSATNVQSAIDQLDGRVDSLNSSINNLDNRVDYLESHNITGVSVSFTSNSDFNDSAHSYVTASTSVTLYGSSSYKYNVCIAHASAKEYRSLGGDMLYISGKTNITLSINSNSVSGRGSVMRMYAVSGGSNLYISASTYGYQAAIMLQAGAIRFK